MGLLLSSSTPLAYSFLWQDLAVRRRIGFYVSWMVHKTRPWSTSVTLTILQFISWTVWLCYLKLYNLASTKRNILFLLITTFKMDLRNSQVGFFKQKHEGSFSFNTALVTLFLKIPLFSYHLIHIWDSSCLLVNQFYPSKLSLLTTDFFKKKKQK